MLLVFLAMASIPSAAGSSPVQKELEARMKPLIQVGGNYFKDLNNSGAVDPYENWMLPAEDRVEDLLARMTFDEKVGQMMHCVLSAKSDGSIPSHVKNEVDASQGFYLARNFPSARSAAVGLNQVQEWAEDTRLGIPIIISIDPLLTFIGGTRMPLSMALGGTDNVELARRVYRDVWREEMTAVGVRMLLGPSGDVATDPRWQRLNDTHGENADLVAEMVRAEVEALQGPELNENSVLACVKHFPGAGSIDNGHDPHEQDKPWSQMVSTPETIGWHLKPFEAAIEAGTWSIMPYYVAPAYLTDLPAHSSPEVMNELLKENLGFEGIINTDWWNFEFPNPQLYQVIKNGADVIGGASAYYNSDVTTGIKNAVENGDLPEERVNNIARKILEAKFKLGLFEDPYVDPDYAEVVVGCEEHQELALEIERQSIALLKNENILPLSRNMNILVAGGYHELVGELEDRLTGGAVFYEGSDTSRAASLAENSDVAVIPVFQLWTHDENDEIVLYAKDSSKNMVSAIHETGTPIVVIYEWLHPYPIPQITDNASAILSFPTQSYPATKTAIAEILLGERSPSGKLPMQVPRSMDQVRNQREDLPYDIEDPLFDCGFGLLYPLADLKVPSSVENLGEPVPISVTVNNLENSEVTRTVELYIDESLVDSEEVTLAPHGSEEVTFTHEFTESGVHVIRVDRLEASVGVNMPATFEYSGLEVTSELETGSITASAGIKNVGGRGGTEKVELYVDAEVVASQDITLDPRETGTVSFSYEFEDSGVHWVGIGDLEPERVRIPGGLILAGIEGEVLHLSFDDKYPKGYDSSGYGNNGTLVGDLRQVDGKFDNALEFPGAQGYYVSVPHSTSLAPLGGLAELSVETWVYVDGTIPTGERYMVAAKFDWETTGWLMKIERRTSAADKFSFVLYVACANGGYWGWVIDDAAPVSQWVHLAFTYEGSTNTLTAYINGTNRNADRIQWAVGSGGNVPSSTGSLYIGSEGGSFNFFKGKIDEVQIYNRALTEDEIQGDYHGNFSYCRWGIHTTEWRYLGGDISWSSLEAATYIPENTRITATVQVSDDGINVKDEDVLDLEDGRHSYPLDLEGRYVRIETELSTENSLRSPMLDWYALTGDGVREVWSTLPEWEAGERMNLITGLIEIPPCAEGRAEPPSSWWLLAAVVGVLVGAALGGRYLLMRRRGGGEGKGAGLQKRQTSKKVKATFTKNNCGN